MEAEFSSLLWVRLAFKVRHYNCTHSYSARRCSRSMHIQNAGERENVGRYCTLPYNTLSLSSSILLRLSIFFPLRGDSIADHPHKLDPKTSIKPTSRPRQLSHRAVGFQRLYRCIKMPALIWDHLWMIWMKNGNTGAQKPRGVDSTPPRTLDDQK